MKNYCLAATALVMGLCLTATAQKRPKPQLYVPMDYSTCGYHASETTIPDVPVAVYVPCQQGDCSAVLQQAIDRVAAMKKPGAVLLGQGQFHLSQPLRINASGVVLRGMGREQTLIVKHGADRGAIVYIEGTTGSAANSTDTLFVDNGKVAAGATTLCVPGSALRAGDRIDIVRPCTRQWIESLAMNDFGGGLDYTGWKATDIDLRWDRTVTAVNADSIAIDAPITMTLDPQHGRTFILKGNHQGEVTECGVENMTLMAAIDSWDETRNEGQKKPVADYVNLKDEDHCWDGIFIEHARDAWVRRVNFRQLAGSAVNLQRHSSRITVEDCVASQPVSEVGGWRRQVFLTRGQQTLFQRCVSQQGIHDFAAGYCAAGPNAFVQCEGEQALGFSGSIGSWAPGLLFDIVNIDGNDLRFANLEQFQFGTGWNTANSMFWQCTASTIECYSPNADNRNSAHGCWGTLTGNGNWTSSNDHVVPRSLFYHQLKQRLGTDAPQAWLLPLSNEATSSPTVEQALAMAHESLTVPRLTMQMWIDSIPFKASVEPEGNRLSGLSRTARTAGTSGLSGTAAPRYTAAPLAIDGRLITGNQYNIPWWSGRVKDNFVSREAKPAITRFVPGREGTGWTDRIDSVALFCAKHHISQLYHHYGLWYDLRRTDHERIRRADGDVWAPFYEQPFARSGQGTAWDGLSRYDLTRPNKWYWQRLRTFAQKTEPAGVMLYHNHYFQHNILEAGAHWVDCPWRPVNNIQYADSTRTPFPEPVPFAGDKRIFVADQFYNTDDSLLRSLHRQYIRMNLEQLKDLPNVVHLISAEYTGPLHFTQFWLQTIAEWEQETGCHPLVALSCTRDAQDSILADPTLSSVVDIIDIRYWHYNTKGLWAPQAGKSLAPRQWMRKMPVGKTGFDEAYRAVREMRDRYPQKAVTFFAQQYPDYGWAILMAGGSMPNVRIDSDELLQAITCMAPVDAEQCLALADSGHDYLVLTLADGATMQVEPGKYRVYTVDTMTGQVVTLQRALRIDGTFAPQPDTTPKVYWLHRL